MHEVDAAKEDSHRLRRILALLVFVLGWAFANVLRLGQASDAILRENYKSILAAESMIDAIERQDSATLLLILGFSEEALTSFRENESAFLQSFARAEDNITIEGEKAIIASIKSGYSEYLVGFSKLRDLTGTGNRDEVGTFYHETLKPAFVHVRDACVRLREINQDTMFAASTRAEAVAQRALWSIAVIGAIAIVAGVGFSLVLSRLLVRPLQELSEAARHVAEGDYDVEVATTSTDELGRVAAEFNAMVGKLRSYRDLNLRQIVTEKQRSDAIIRSIDDGIIVVDEELKVININRAAASALNVERSEAQGRHFLEVVNNEKLFGHVKQTVESGRPPDIAEGEDVLRITRGEETHHYLFSIVPVQASEEVLRGVVLVLRDVTRLKELEKLKSEFVMTASHELKTPLTGIEMSVDLLREQLPDKLSGEQMELLSAAHEDVHRLKALLKDLLDFSKIESGKVEMDFARVPVSVFVDKAISVLKSQADEKSIELTAEVPDDVPEVRADANKVSWILTNLITNALRYTEPGGHIRVSAESGRGQVYVSVSDDGTGIPEEHQSKIFDKFVKVGGAESEGTGLGLAICREIVRAHGGTIWLESEVGKGSTFTFSLPAAE